MATPDAPPPLATPSGSRIVIEFGGLGQSEAQVSLHGVAPGQVYSAAFLLGRIAAEIREGKIKPAGGLAVARGSLPGN